MGGVGIAGVALPAWSPRNGIPTGWPSPPAGPVDGRPGQPGTDTCRYPIGPLCEVCGVSGVSTEEVQLIIGSL